MNYANIKISTTEGGISLDMTSANKDNFLTAIHYADPITKTDAGRWYDLHEGVKTQIPTKGANNLIGIILEIKHEGEKVFQCFNIDCTSMTMLAIDESYTTRTGIVKTPPFSKAQVEYILSH